MKKLRSCFLLLCVCILMFSLTACGPSESEPSEVVVSDVSFPLSEPVTFTFMISGTEGVSFKDNVANNTLYQKLKEETNVNIEFQFIGNEGSDQLNLLMSSGNYGDVIWGGPILSSTMASKYIAAGHLIDLLPYIQNTELMPNLNRQMQENSAYLNMITATDGKVYTLPKITGLQGHYLESPIWINKKWLDTLSLDVPTTVDEFVDVLRAFRDRDPNQNGVQDEIPYICSTAMEGGYSHTEALLGLFGVATKGGVNDSFVMVQDKKVNFAPAMEEYKAGIEFLSKLYQENLMWSECFTSTESNFLAKMTSETCVVGCFTSVEPYETDYSDDYIVIAPPSNPGYEAKWYLHPAYNGSKNLFFVTKKCKNANVLMAWVDKLYDLDNAIAFDYGLPEDGRITYEDGKYTILELDYLQLAEIDKEKPTLNTLWGNGVRGISVDDYQNRINLGKKEKIEQNNYEIYKDYVHTEVWPRPYYAPEDAYDADIYSTDILYQVQSYRARWITGQADVNDEWDEYIAKLNSIGLEDYMRILQKSYDAYLNVG